ncbi:MAG: FAD-dependent oxidoreductase, partial [Erysipelotrichaceae bacterium]|nr:FAD-dependent oxidoreductase [Erysipelotrichaceae bacterium]
KSLSGCAMVNLVLFAEDYEKYGLDATKEKINVAKQDGAKVSVEVSFFPPVPDEDGLIYGPGDGIRYDGKPTKALDRKGMDQIIEEMVHECVSCRKLGVDVLYLEFGHDSLHSQFMSPVWNRRTDEYGGSVENRGRFARETLQAIRDAVGRDYPIILRISRNLMVEETYTEDEMLEFLKSVENIVDMVNVSCAMDCYGGTVDNYVSNIYAIPTVFAGHMFSKDFARRVKQETKLLVCLSGAVMNAQEGEELIAGGWCDAIACARSLVADPYWPKKILDGKENDIVPCIRCMQCYHVASSHWNVQCSVNPWYRRETRRSLKSLYSSGRKHVTVIGGGPAGMIAALGANEAGHEVTLIEKEERLGGLLNWACKGEFKEDLMRYLEYLVNKVNSSGIDIRLDTEADAELIRSLRTDRLIIATGSRANILKIEGFEKAIDSLDAIDRMEEIKGNIVIIGSGSTGAELGLDLAMLGNDVTVIGMEDEIACNANSLYRVALKEKMKEYPEYHHLNRTKLLK